MLPAQPFNAGPRLSDVPGGDPATQAVASLRGYAYQLYVSALAWLELKPDQLLYLEVAKDYAVVAADAIRAVEVKDTPSVSVTINSEDVLDTIDHFVDLIERNPGKTIDLRFLCTSPVALERKKVDRAGNMATLEYWRRVASGADAKPLRTILERAKLSPRARTFIDTRDDDALRRDLLRRIHWDCGQPPLDVVAEELDGALVRYGAEHAEAPAADKDRMRSAVLMTVLNTVIQQEGSRRTVTSADLLRVVKDATAITLYRPELNALLTALAIAAMPSQAAASAVSIASNILEPERDFPLPSLLAERRSLTSKLLERLCKNGVVVITGSTGSGKTVLARQIAQEHGGDWLRLDLREANGGVAVQRLEQALAALGTVAAAGILVDDCNAIEDPVARRAAAKFISAVRRRDGLCVVTAYTAPSNRALAELGIDKTACIAAPDLTAGEVSSIVATAGGDIAKWSRLIYRAGAFGHPQLVMAIVAGLRSRSWPAEELPSLRSYSRSDDVEAEKLATRRRLFEVLPAEAATLLHRTSLLFGRFERSLVLALGGIAPEIAAPGAQLDKLIGPWVEQLGSDEFRVSPLLKNAGYEILTTAMQEVVHRSAAEHIVSGNRIPIDKFDAAFLHSIFGKSPLTLTKIAYSIISARPDQRRVISEWSFGLRLHRFDRPIYVESLTLSILLRLAQFMLVAVQGSADGVASCWLALKSEIAREPDPVAREQTEYIALVMVLVDISAAGLLPDWIDLVLRLQALTDANPDRQKTMERANRPVGERRSTTTPSMFFMLHAMSTRSVAQLQSIFNRLDELTSEQRDLLFADALNAPSDFSLVVNRPWLEESKRGRIDAAASAEAYRLMASQAQSWGYRELALRCHVARGVMFDEYAADPTTALKALADGAALLGDDPVISRARAKILYRQKDHAGALELLRGTADKTALNDPVERAFMLREAGISAAETGQWAEALQWFASACDNARRSRTPDMKVMAIGLRADSAIAAFRSGDVTKALSEFDGVLDELARLDPESSLNAGYCHRVVRHAVLWLFGEGTDRDIRVEDDPAALVPGMCSNPEPVDLSDRPLGALDYAYYLLAETEIALVAPAGVGKKLQARLGARGIPAMECMLAFTRELSAIKRLNLDGFIENLPGWVEAQLYLSANSARLPEQNMVSPTYAVIPRATSDDLKTPATVSAVEDALLSFALLAALSGRAELIDSACARIRTSAFSHAAEHVAVILTSGLRVEGRLQDHLGLAVYRLANRPDLVPDDLFIISLRFFEFAKHSNFKRVLGTAIAKWMRSKWSETIEGQSFRLRRPITTVPDIEQALSASGDSLTFTAKLLLAIEPAVTANLQESMRDLLRSA